MKELINNWDKNLEYWVSMWIYKKVWEHYELNWEDKNFDSKMEKYLTSERWTKKKKK